MDDIETELEALERMFSDSSAEPIRLSYGLLRSITDNFSNEIGRGGFGVVYMGYLGNGKVAVKKFSNLHALPDKQFLGEISCLKKAKHENIVRFLGYCSETQGELHEFNGENVMAEVQNKLLCFEYVPGGNIRHYLQQEKPHGDDWPARYRMIRGVCRGLHCLHDKQINHLDLKPENVMLDAQLEPKITDFGLSRFLDQGQSNMITQHIVGTPRYIAREIIDKGEISFKSDMYALGIIIIELLTGISLISLENWDESLDEDCPRMRACIEIARNCTDPDKHNRPTVHEVISELDELESMIPLSSINQATFTAFPGTELLDVYPLELRFSFMPDKEMHCHLSLINKTDGGVYCAIIPEVPDRYRGRLQNFLPPMSTTTITLNRDAEEKLPSDTDKLEILMLLTGSNFYVVRQRISKLSLEEDTSCQDTFKAAHELLGFELHQTTMTAVVVYEAEDQPLVVNTAGKEEEFFSSINCMDVHPTEPWVLIVKDYGYTVYIWNMQTKESIGIYNPVKPIAEKLCLHDMLAKFIPRKQWVVIGSSSGSITVRTCPAMDQVLEFKAHHTRVTSLAVHPTRPLLLSYSNPVLTLKLWDWNRGWSCTRIFVTSRPVRQVMFNPKHTSTFATRDDTGIVKMWRTDHPVPVARTHIVDHFWNVRFFTYSGDQHFIAAIDGRNTNIWDLQKEKHVHTLHIPEIEQRVVVAVCHPTRPVLVTASEDGSVRVWNSTTDRLKKAYFNLPKYPTHIGFTGLKRLVIGYSKGISVLDIDME